MESTWWTSKLVVKTENVAGLFAVQVVRLHQEWTSVRVGLVWCEQADSSTAAPAVNTSLRGGVQYYIQECGLVQDIAVVEVGAQ